MVDVIVNVKDGRVGHGVDTRARYSFPNEVANVNIMRGATSRGVRRDVDVEAPSIERLVSGVSRCARATQPKAGKPAGAEREVSECARAGCLSARMS